MALCLVLFVVVRATTDMMVVSLFSIAPLVAATVADERRTAVFAGAAVALAIGAGWSDGATGSVTYWIRVAVVCAISAMAVVVAGMRRRREERLARMTAVAETAQLALLPPLPPEMTGIGIAARYRSATHKASVGGDLYEIIPTGHGIRVIIGDVRGKGLTPSCSPGTCSAPSGEAPSPCPPWNKRRARSAGPSCRTWAREKLRHRSAGRDHHHWQADHCQLRPSPAAAAPPRRPAAADRREARAATWPRRGLHRFHRNLVAGRPAAALHRRAGRKPRRPRALPPGTRDRNGASRT